MKFSLQVVAVLPLVIFSISDLQQVSAEFRGGIARAKTVDDLLNNRQLKLSKKEECKKKCKPLTFKCFKTCVMPNWMGMKMKMMKKMMKTLPLSSEPSVAPSTLLSSATSVAPSVAPSTLLSSATSVAPSTFKQNMMKTPALSSAPSSSTAPSTAPSVAQSSSTAPSTAPKKKMMMKTPALSSAPSSSTAPSTAPSVAPSSSTAPSTAPKKKMMMKMTTAPSFASSISVAPSTLTVTASDCWRGLGGLQLSLFKFDEYDTYFRDDSKLTLAQAGTYQGADGIKEYIKFGSPFSPYFASFVPSPPGYILTGLDGNICTFTDYGYNQYTYNETVVGSSDVFEIPVVTKLSYDAVGNYVTDVRLNFLPGFLEYFFGTLSGPEGIDYVCGVMDECDLGVNIGGPCQERLGELPVLTDGVMFDGNSIGCRVLHAVFASENSNHCAHISFEPMEDPNGFIKCQKSKGMDILDLFTVEEIEAFHQHAEDQGIDLDVGYKIVDPILLF